MAASLRQLSVWPRSSSDGPLSSPWSVIAWSLDPHRKVVDRLRHQPEVRQHHNPQATCTIAFDHKDFQFSCPGTSLRWNRTGQPLGAYHSPDQALQLRIATIAHDGHILYSPALLRRTPPSA